MISVYKLECARVDEVLYQTVWDVITQVDACTKYTEFRLPLAAEPSNPDHLIAKQILDNVFEMYKRKNADYGNSFARQYAKHGDLSYVIRKDDKAFRFEQLMKHDALVLVESKEDTVMDSMGYDLLWLIEQEKIKREKGDSGDNF